MKIKFLFKEERVERTAVYIAAELEKLLNRKDYDSPMNRYLNKAPDSKTLTNSEHVIVTLRALNMVAIRISKELTSFKQHIYDDYDEEEDEEGEHSPNALPNLRVVKPEGGK